MNLNGTPIPPAFSWTLEQVAEITGASIDTIRRNAKRKPGDRYYLATRRDTPAGALKVTSAALDDYLTRTETGYIPAKAAA